MSWRVAGEAQRACVFLLRSGRECAAPAVEHDDLRVSLCAKHGDHLVGVVADLVHHRQMMVAAERASIASLLERMERCRGSITRHGKGWRFRLSVPVTEGVTSGTKQSVQRSGFRTKRDASEALRITRDEMLTLVRRDLSVLAAEQRHWESVNQLVCAHAMAVDRVLRQELASDLERRRVERDATQHERFVYYVRRPDGRIKIGTTWDLQKRVSSFATVQRVELLAAHRGGRHAERGLHRRFSADRVEREWFEPSRALLRHIDHVAAVRPLDPTGTELGPRSRNDQRPPPTARAVS